MGTLQDRNVTKNRKIVLYWQSASFLKELIRSIVCGTFWSIERKVKRYSTTDITYIKKKKEL